MAGAIYNITRSEGNAYVPSTEFGPRWVGLTQSSSQTSLRHTERIHTNSDNAQLGRRCGSRSIVNVAEALIFEWT